MTLPKLSIAAKLYAIFALMATTTLALSLVAVLNARSHAALTHEFESANAGGWNIERINGLIYAAVQSAASLALGMSPDDAYRAGPISPIRKSNDMIDKVITDGQNSVGAADADAFRRIFHQVVGVSELCARAYAHRQ